MPKSLKQGVQSFEVKELHLPGFAFYQGELGGDISICLIQDEEGKEVEIDLWTKINPEDWDLIRLGKPPVLSNTFAEWEAFGEAAKALLQNYGIENFDAAPFETRYINTETGELVSEADAYES